MHVSSGNPGNTVLDQPIQTDGEEAETVETHMLDDYFGGTFPYIHLMKVDAQGFEMKILRGAKQLLASGAVNALKMELAPGFLEGQGSSAAELLSMLLQNGYTIHTVPEGGHWSKEDSKPLKHGELRAIACVMPEDTFIDILAVRGQPDAPHKVRCLEGQQRSWQEWQKL